MFPPRSSPEVSRTTAPEASRTWTLSVSGVVPRRGPPERLSFTVTVEVAPATPFQRPEPVQVAVLPVDRERGDRAAVEAVTSPGTQLELAGGGPSACAWR